MEVVVSGRNCDISSRFREHVEGKLEKLAKHDHRIMRIDVVITKERNPRRAERGMKAELTAKSRGPIIRAEAAAETKMTALDKAVEKMESQMRRASDRRKAARRGKRGGSLAEAMASTVDVAIKELEDLNQSEDSVDEPASASPVAVDGDGPLVVREKTHQAAPMTLDQAMYEMELVGHDFFLFVDKESERPSVVYRRHGYDYGVIYLELT